MMKCLGSPDGRTREFCSRSLETDPGSGSSRAERARETLPPSHGLHRRRAGTAGAAALAGSMMLAIVVAAVPALAQVQKKDVPGIVNYSRVDATVGCGGSVTPSAMQALKAEGYRSIVNLRQASERGADIEASREAAKAAGLNYIHLPFNAASPDTAVVDRFLAAVADTGNQPVFIHCGSANRVGGLWMIKRVLRDKWPVEKAQAEAEVIGLRDPKLTAFAVEYIKAKQ